MAFKKGNKLGGRKKNENGLDLKKMMIPFLPDAIGTLVELLTCDKDSARFSAAKEIIDRVFGKAKESVELSGEGGGAIQINVNIAEKK